MEPLSDDILLNDDTKIKHSTWKDLKEYYMPEDYIKSNKYVSDSEFPFSQHVAFRYNNLKWPSPSLNS